MYPPWDENFAKLATFNKRQFDRLIHSWDFLFLKAMYYISDYHTDRGIF